MPKHLKTPWPGEILSGPALWIQATVLGTTQSDDVRKQLTAAVFLSALERQVDAADRVLDDVANRYRRERHLAIPLAQARAKILPIRKWILFARATAGAAPDLTIPSWIALGVDDLAARGAEIGCLVETLQPKAKRARPGRPPSGTEVEDRRISESWASGRYRTYEDLASRLGKTSQEVRRAIDRHRKKIKASSEKPRSRG